ncbi:hypothetical protein MHYP_G00107330 [Metynnis hypsauchen]
MAQQRISGVHEAAVTEPIFLYIQSQVPANCWPKRMLTRPLPCGDWRLVVMDDNGPINPIIMPIKECECSDASGIPGGVQKAHEYVVGEAVREEAVSGVS